MVADCCLERGCEEVARLLGPGGGVLANSASPRWPTSRSLRRSGGPFGRRVRNEGEGSLHSRLIEALGETLTEFGRTSPVVLFLDDLEWADALTLHFLALFHVGVWDHPNVAIVAAYRSEAEDCGDPANICPSFATPPFIDVEPLEPASLREIVRDMLGSNEVDDRFVAHLARRSGGNPFFVAEFLRAAVAEGVLRRDWPRWVLAAGDPSRRDGAALDARGRRPRRGDRPARLASRPGGPPAREPAPTTPGALLELAAVVGREVDADLLETVEPLGEARTMAALEPPCSSPRSSTKGRDGHFPVRPRQAPRGRLRADRP